MKALRFNGVKVPKGVQTEDELMRLQNTVGVPATGVWDFLSEAAYEKYLKRFDVPLTTAYQVDGYSAPGMVRNQRDVKLMQEVLGNVTVDGIWGPETDSAYKARITAEQGVDIAYPKPATTAKPIQSAPAASTMPAAFKSAPATAGIAGKTTLGLPVQGADAGGSSGAPGWEKATVPGTDLQFGSTIEVEVYYGKRLQELWEAYSAAAVAATNRKTRTKQDQDALTLAQKNYTDMQKEYQDALAAVQEQENRYYSDRFNYYYENKETDEETPFFYNPSDVDEHYGPLQDYLDYIYDHSDEGRDITLDMIDDFYDDFLPKYTQMLSETTNYVLPEWNPYPYKTEEIVVVDEDTNEPHKVLIPNDPDCEEILDVCLSIENGEIPLISSSTPASYRPFFERLSGVKDVFAYTPYYKDSSGYHVDIYKNGKFLTTFYLGQELPDNVSISIWKPNAEDLFLDIIKLYYEIARDTIISGGAVALASGAAQAITGYELTASDKFWIDQFLSIPGVDDSIVQLVINSIRDLGGEWLNNVIDTLMEKPEYYFQLDTNYLIQMKLMDNQGKVIRRSKPFVDN